jgi:hypothetical protein
MLFAISYSTVVAVLLGLVFLVSLSNNDDLRAATTTTTTITTITGVFEKGRRHWPLGLRI